MMIAYLNGELVQKKDGIAVMDIHGIGYQLEISNQTLANLPATGAKVKLLVHHHITENDQRLFGFWSKKEKDLFEKLITVKGIGPKLGLTILSGMAAPSLLEAIVKKDLMALSGIPGIGKKTAERMVLELKDKLFDEFDYPGTTQSGNSDISSIRGEAVSALEALGFKKRDAEKAVMNVKDTDMGNDVSGVIKKALLSLNR
ncbi:MAG: Holliday junction branch migration protein RuvA [Balneolaceae bacterium]